MKMDSTGCRDVFPIGLIVENQRISNSIGTYRTISIEGLRGPTT